jgi:type II secretory pathway pseudopilin PulG
MIELMIVFAVVIVVLAIAIPQFLRVKQRARAVKAMAKYEQLVNQYKAQAYYTCAKLEPHPLPTETGKIVRNNTVGGDPTSPSNEADTQVILMTGGTEVEGPIPGTKALQLKATDREWGEVPRGNFPAQGDSYTVTLWFKPLEPIADVQMLLKKGYMTHSWRVAINNGKFEFAAISPLTTVNSAVAWSHTIKADTWYFLVGVYKGSAPDRRVELWVNGEKMGEDVWLSGPPDLNRLPILLGRDQATNFLQMATGAFANIALFPSALTEEQIQALYLTGKP